VSSERPHVRGGRGHLVVLEGIDGAGKSTQATVLAAALREQGWTVRESREPTRGVHGQALRDSATSGRLTLSEELRLLELDRREHVRDLIEPTLQAGELVLLDRYYFSTAAYQGARGADPLEIIAHHETFAPRPTLTMILDLSPEVSMRRVAHRGMADAFEGLGDLRRCRAIYRQLVAADVVLVDADVPSDRLTAQLLDLTLGRIGR